MKLRMGGSPDRGGARKRHLFKLGQPEHPELKPEG